MTTNPHRSLHKADQVAWSHQAEDVEAGNAGRAPMCPYCLGKGAHHYHGQAESLMCSRCLGTGTVQR